MIKELNFKHEERNVDVAKESREMMYRKQPMKNAGFSSGTADATRQQNSIAEVLKYGKVLPTQNFISCQAILQE